MGGWWDSITGAAAATVATPFSFGGLFQSSPQVLYSGGGTTDLVREPGSTFDALPWDPTLPYKDRPGNQGCPPGFYTSYEDDGSKLCRPIAGYTPEAAQANATSFSSGVLQGFAGSLQQSVNAVSTTAKSVIPSIKSSSYIIIAVLVAAGFVLLAGSRFLGKVEGR